MTESTWRRRSRWRYFWWRDSRHGTFLGIVNFHPSYQSDWGIEGRDVANDAQLGARERRTIADHLTADL
jgi:hypothetical protein